jgi:hypothetical protein
MSVDDETEWLLICLAHKVEDAHVRADQKILMEGRAAISHEIALLVGIVHRQNAHDGLGAIVQDWNEIERRRLIAKLHGREGLAEHASGKLISGCCHQAHRQTRLVGVERALLGLLHCRTSVGRNAQA